MSQTSKRPPSRGGFLAYVLLIAVVAGGGYWCFQRARPLFIKPPAPLASEPAPQIEDPPPATPATQTLPPAAAPVKDFAALVAESQRRAVAAHPDLGKLNTGLNTRFRNKITDLRAHNDPRLKAPDWPEKLADEAAKAPMLISLTTASGKKLYFDTEEQRARYEQALQRSHPEQLLTNPPPPPPPPAPSASGGDSTAGPNTPPPTNAEATLKGRVIRVDVVSKVLIVYCTGNPQTGGDESVDGVAALGGVPQLDKINVGMQVDVKAKAGGGSLNVNPPIMGAPGKVALYEYTEGQFLPPAANRPNKARK